MVTSLWKRLAWLITIWVLSVCALGLIAFSLRFLMMCAGFKS